MFTRYLYDCGDYESMEQELLDINWDEVLTTNDVNKAWLLFHSNFVDLFDKYVPVAHSGQKTTCLWWLNCDVLFLIKEKRRAWRCYRKSKKTIDYLNYASVRNKVTLAIRKAKRSFESHLIFNLKSNPKRFWKYVNNSSKVCAEIGKLKLPDGSLTSTFRETAGALNNYFDSVFTMEDLSQPPFLKVLFLIFHCLLSL